jgi:hypothetical protein
VSSSSPLVLLLITIIASQSSSAPHLPSARAAGGEFKEYALGAIYVVVELPDERRA